VGSPVLSTLALTGVSLGVPRIHPRSRSTVPQMTDRCLTPGPCVTEHRGAIWRRAILMGAASEALLRPAFSLAGDRHDAIWPRSVPVSCRVIMRGSEDCMCLARVALHWVAALDIAVRSLARLGLRSRTHCLVGIIVSQPQLW
jgi:hypothetical protein